MRRRRRLQRAQGEISSAQATDREQRSWVAGGNQLQYPSLTAVSVAGGSGRAWHCGRRDSQRKSARPCAEAEEHENRNWCSAVDRTPCFPNPRHCLQTHCMPPQPAKDTSDRNVQPYRCSDSAQRPDSAAAGASQSLKHLQPQAGTRQQGHIGAHAHIQQQASPLLRKGTHTHTHTCAHTGTHIQSSIQKNRGTGQ